MPDLIKYFVECRRDAAVLATYEFAQTMTPAGPPREPDQAALEAEAKDNLIQERVAFPPFDGVTFHIRRR